MEVPGLIPATTTPRASKPRAAPRTDVRRGLGLFVCALLLITGGAINNALPRIAHDRSHQAFGHSVSHVDTDQKVVALTFDDGPSADPGPVLEVLRAHNIKATFFVNGAAMSRNPRVVPELINDGQQIGNHTWSHRRMTRVAPWTVASELDRTDRLIRQAGYRGRIAVRPPYGDRFIALPLRLALERRPSIMWDVEPENFRPGQTAQQMVERGMAQVRPGSIIVMHPWWDRERTRLAADTMISLLQSRGYRFVTVDQLMALHRGNKTTNEERQ